MSLKNNKIEEINGELKSNLASNAKELEEKVKKIKILRSLLDSQIKDESDF